MTGVLVASVLLTAASGKEPDQAIEVDLFAGWGVTAVTAEPISGRIAPRNHAPVVALTVLYRSPYFLAPFLDLGWAPLLSSTDTVMVDDAAAELESSMSVFWIVAGPAFHFWRMRLGAGIGAYWLHIRSTLAGVTITPDDLNLGYAAYLSGSFVHLGWLEIAAELRGAYVSEADIAHLSLGVSARFSPLRW